MMLKSTRVKIELLTDIDMIMYLEQNMRGGMSYVNQRFCKSGSAVNKKTGQKFYGEILYIDGELIHHVMFSIERQFIF
jgi:hypothetical protein